VRDVATCPELSCDYVNASGETVNQSKPLTTNAEIHTDSAPSMLPAPQSTASDTQHLSVSQSAPGVGMPRVSAGQQIQCGHDVVNAGGSRSDSDGCVNVVVTSTVVSCRPTDAAAPVVPPPSDAAEEVTQLARTATNVVASPGLTRAQDEASESADIPAESSGTETVCDNTSSSVTPAPCEFKADSVGSASNAVCTDRVPCTSLSSETDTDSAELPSKTLSESENHPAFAALRPAVEMPYVDTSTDTSCDSAAIHGTQPDSSSRSTIVTVNEESNMSVTECDKLCYLSATVDDVDDGLTCCAGADYASNDESHSTIDDLHLVSKPIPVCRVLYCVLHMRVCTVIEIHYFLIKGVRVMAGVKNMGN